MPTDLPLTLERVAIDRQISSKEDALRRISSLLAGAVPELSAEAVFAGLMERERLGGTCLGHGTALPHSRLGRSVEAVGALLSLPAGVDFGAADGEPVHLLFGLLVPEDADAQHLRILAVLAAAFRDRQFSADLRSAVTPEDLLARFSRGTEGL